MPKTLNEDSKKSMLNNEKPLGKAVPGAPFVVVALSYLLVLVLVLGVLGLAFWLR